MRCLRWFHAMLAVTAGDREVELLLDIQLE